MVRGIWEFIAVRWRINERGKSVQDATNEWIEARKATRRSTGPIDARKRRANATANRRAKAKEKVAGGGGANATDNRRAKAKDKVAGGGNNIYYRCPNSLQGCSCWSGLRVNDYAAIGQSCDMRLYRGFAI